MTTRKEESDHAFETIFSTMLNDMEKKINGIDLSNFNKIKEELNKQEIKPTDTEHFDLIKEFEKIENDTEINQTHPEMINNLKQVMFLIDTLKQFMPPMN